MSALPNMDLHPRRLVEQAQRDYASAKAAFENATRRLAAAIRHLAEYENVSPDDRDWFLAPNLQGRGDGLEIVRFLLKVNGPMKVGELQEWLATRDYHIDKEGNPKKGDPIRRVIGTGLANGSLLLNGQDASTPSRGVNLEFQDSDVISLAAGSPPSVGG